MRYLRNNTNTRIAVGPFLDKTDGVTPETELTVTNDLLTFVVDTSGVPTLVISAAPTVSGGVNNMFHIINDSSGFYDISLSASDVNYYGRAMMALTDAANHCPVFHEFEIVPANIYDSMILGSDTLYANVIQMENNIITSATIASNAITSAGIATGAITSAKFSENAINAAALDTDAVTEIQTGLATSATLSEVKAKTDSLTFSVANQVNANIISVYSSSSAASILRSQFDGTGIIGDTYPARQDQLQNIVSTGAAVNQAAESFTLSAGVQAAGTYADTAARDGTIHQLQDSAGTLDCYYQFDIGSTGVPTSISLYMANTSGNDTIRFFGWNWNNSSWIELGSKSGTIGIIYSVQTFPLYTSMVGIGIDVGKVRIRLYNTGLTTSNTYIDQIFVSYAFVNQSIGYSQGAIWIDTINGTSGTTSFVNGTADRPALTYAQAITIATAMNIHNFRIVAGSNITLTANHDYDSFIGVGGQWNLDCGGQSIAGTYFESVNVSGIGIASISPTFRFCSIGAGTTLPPSYFYTCGFDTSSVFPFIAGSAGQYLFVDCMSLVAGSEIPYFVFSGTGGTTGINIRKWSGGTNITLDSNCTCSIEVVAGGGQTVTTGGANLEIRGICRAVTITSSGSSITQIAAVTGPITINGTSGTVRIYGVCGDVIDNSGGFVSITNDAISQETIPDTVWNEIRSAHISAGTFGEGINVASLSANSINSTVIASNAITSAGIATGAITSAKFAIGAIDAAAIATNAIDADSLATDAVTEIQSGLATSATLAEVKAKTDSLTFTIPNAIDSNIVDIYGISAASQNMSISTVTMVRGTITDASFSPTSTQFEASDITNASANFYTNRTVIFTSGSLANQARGITIYTLTGGRGHFTVDALTSAPANGDTFIIV